ncbi:unnamed protein product [Prunus armeniaca]|uniref:BURP domain-containing protein n=1 Tax=Prunus armeniaca TaxID=36596 RepID=A0A6J5Y810_PRUAR|nr:unnamed protein product [Prunus armeniaca]
MSMIMIIQHHPMHHMDPALNVFFTPKDLKLGKTMPIYFSKNDPSTSPRILPREEAASIPFSISKLPYILEFFSFTQDSPQAKAIEFTLTQCELEPIKVEAKFCAASIESMLDLVGALFGSSTKFKVLTTTQHKKLTTLLQNYTVLEALKEILAPKMIGCHTMPYPYAVFYCHSQESENRIYQVLLGCENGERVEAAAVCHFDTSKSASEWDPSHVAFNVFGVQPGSCPVCHFFPADNLVWVPLPA